MKEIKERITERLVIGIAISSCLRSGKMFVIQRRKRLRKLNALI
jgi:hypothetical protein